MEDMEKDVSDGADRARYYVLFVQTLKQWEAGEALRKTLLEGRGTVFYPCVELWMKSLGQTVIEPLFPGYVFIRSELPKNEVHEFVKGIRREVLTFIKELGMDRDREMGFAEDLTDLDAAETEFLDFMLGFRYEDGAASGDNGGSEKDAASDFVETQPGKTAKGKKIYRRKLPKAGVLAMSCGYRDADGRIVVMEGPLAGHEKRIVDVNPKERRAYLDIKVGGRPARAGLELKSRRCWHPEDKKAPVMLGDGFVVNPEEIAAAMMRPRPKAAFL